MRRLTCRCHYAVPAPRKCLRRPIRAHESYDVKSASKMKKITPRDFRNAFVAVMKAEHNSFRTAVGFEVKSYTYFLRSDIFPKIAKHLGLLAWHKDYYALDGMFYEERGTDS